MFIYSYWLILIRHIRLYLQKSDMLRYKRRSDEQVRLLILPEITTINIMETVTLPTPKGVL